MDRKGIIAVALAVVGLIFWQTQYSRQMAAYQKAKQAYDAAAADKAKTEHPETAAASTASTPPAAPEGANPEPPKAPEKVEEKIDDVLSPSPEHPSAQYKFTNLGGGIAQVVLLEGKQPGSAASDVTLNGFGDVPIGAITEHADEDVRAPFTATVDPVSGVATFGRTDARHLQTEKKFTLSRDSDYRRLYLIGLDVTFTNRGAAPIQIGSYYVHTGSAGPIHRQDRTLYTGFDYFNGSNFFKSVAQFSSGGVFGFGRKDAPVLAQSAPDVAWAAVTNQYFSTIVTPGNAKGSAVWARKFSVSDEELNRLLPAPNQAAPKDPLLAVQGALGMSGFTLEPGQSASQHFDIYAGPREYRTLRTMTANQSEIMDFGYVKPVSVLLLDSMNWLHAHLGSYAAAIIVLTLIVRGLMWPLQNRQNRMMKQMQQLAPKMEEVKKKYQDDPEKMSRETMKLYGDYGLNPLSQVTGCLPMLLQIPIFFGLFNMLGKAVELRNSHFFWVHDLSQPDTIAMLPGLGIPINILPICMAGTMFLQMRLTPRTGDPAQQKIMMLMPFGFVFFCYNYASALALYWTVQNLVSMVQLYVTRNQKIPILQKVAPASKKKLRR